MHVLLVAAAVPLGACISGCGPSSPAISTVPVSGVVTLDGAPAEHAVVTFVPIDGTVGFGTSATTDAEGRYVLRTPLRQSGLTGQRVTIAEGVPPGRYRVHVSRRLHDDGSPMRADETPIESPAVETIARAFSDVNASTLKVEVPAGGGTFDWKVKGVKAKP